MLNTSTSVFTFHSSASAQKGTVCPKRTQSSNQNAIHKTNKWCKIQALPCFFCELFHDNLSYRYFPHWYMPGRQRVTYEVACLFLLLWACLIGQQVVVVSARVRGNTTHLLQIRDRFRLFACCLLSFPAHGPSWDGGSWRGLHSASAGVALFESFFGMGFLLRSRQGLMWNLAAFLDRNPPPSCFLYSSPVSIWNYLLVKPPGLLLNTGCWGYHLLYFPSKQETKTEKVLSPRWVRKFEHAVVQRSVGVVFSDISSPCRKYRVFGWILAAK